VKHYFTFNEVSVFIKGIINGVHAPGLKMTPDYYVKAFHNILRAHGRSVQVLRQQAPAAKVGIAPAIMPYVPKAEEDVEACRRMLFAVKRTIDGKPNDPLETFINVPSMLLDPIVFGRYPEDGLSVIEPFLPRDWRAHMAQIAQPIDFIAFNTYQGRVAFDDGAGNLRLEPLKTGYARTAIDWPVTPSCLRWVVRFLWERYQMPLYISENGLSSHDWVCLDGKVHDSYRIDYLNRHLLGLEKAIEEGADVRGYFQWSLMDNFEWARGYFDRFGLIYVDYPTGERIIKDSGFWYREVIATNGALLHAHD
jgi:beta-glucosidase